MAKRRILYICHNHPHIRPGGYVCLQPALYRYRWNWRKLRRRTSPSYDVYGRFGTTDEKQDVRAAAISQIRENATASIAVLHLLAAITRIIVCEPLTGHIRALSSATTKRR